MEWLCTHLQPIYKPGVHCQRVARSCGPTILHLWSRVKGRAVWYQFRQKNKIHFTQECYFEWFLWFQHSLFFFFLTHICTHGHIIKQTDRLTDRQKKECADAYKHAREAIILLSVQDCVSDINDWMTDSKVHLKEEKTEAMQFVKISNSNSSKTPVSQNPAPLSFLPDYCYFLWFNRKPPFLSW